MPSPLLHTSNPLWFPAGAEAGFEGVPISNAIHYGHLAACSEYFLTVATGFNSGGSVALLDLAKPGRYEGETYHRTQCHSNSVTDLDWRDDILATSSLDKTVKLWRVQSHGNGADNTSALVHVRTLDHKDRVVNVAWCPLDASLLATALYGKKVFVWNIENGKMHSVHLGSAGGHSLCWSSSGGLAVASRDKRLCIFDVERGEKRPVVSMICHRGSKPWKAAFLDDSTLVTVGFGLEGSKEFAIWDLKNPSSALDRARCNQSSGSVIMNYYQGNRFLFLSGRGDNGIQVYKYESRSMSMVGQFQSPHPYRDICWMQQEYLDAKSREIGRCFRLFQPDTAVVLSTGSRRRNSLFSTSLYQQDFGGPFGLGKSHARRKLSAPLIEPLSIRLQEGDNDDEEEEEEEVVTVQERASNNIQTSKFAGQNVVGALKKPRLASLSKKRDFDRGEYANSTVVAMHLTSMHDKTFKNYSSQSTTYGVLSRREEGPLKPPPIPPKPKTKRMWNNWKVIPEAVQGRLNRMVEKKPAVLKVQENNADDCADKGRHSDDEILFITPAFNCKRASMAVNGNAAEKPTQETDEGDGYATCSVSDLVAVFEAKAAQMAAVESASLCSESLSNAPVEDAPAMSVEAPVVTQATEAVVLNSESSYPAFSLRHPLNRASQLIYQPKPLNRMYTSPSHQRWSISHPIGIQMSPALRYMQRSQRTSVHLSRSTLQTNNDGASGVVVRRPSLRIPISDSRERIQGETTESTLKSPLVRRQMEASPTRKEWHRGVCLGSAGDDVVANRQEPSNKRSDQQNKSSVSASTISAKVVSVEKPPITNCLSSETPSPTKSYLHLPSRPVAPNNYGAKTDNPQKVLQQDEGPRPAGSCDQTGTLSPTAVQLSNFILREQLFDFLEKDTIDASPSPTLEELINQDSKEGCTVKDESTEIGSMGELTLTSQHNEPLTSECDSIPEKLIAEKWDMDESLRHLKPSKKECEIVEALAYPERTSIRLIPVVGPVNPSKLSLLDEFRLLKTQWSSVDTLKSDVHVETYKTNVGKIPSNATSNMPEDTKYKSTITLGRSSTFSPPYSSSIEPRQYCPDQGAICSPSNQAPIQTSRTFYEGYAKYLRDLESTVQRCCGDHAPDTSQPNTPNAQEERGCECNFESETEKSATYVQYAALPMPRKMKEGFPPQGKSSDEPHSDCDETYVGTMTDTDSDALSSTYSVSTPN